MSPAGRHLPDDWYSLPIPANVAVAADAYLDSSYAFALFHSRRRPGLAIGRASGAYDRAAFIVGPRGRVTVGDFTVLNGTYVICDDRVAIGAHCLLSWGVVITDNWPRPSASHARRRAALLAASGDPLRHPPSAADPQPVVLEDNVWVGFDAVVLPGVRLGRGCVIGCKSVVSEDVPPYAVAVGQPAKVIRELLPGDTDEVKASALRQLRRGS